MHAAALHSLSPARRIIRLQAHFFCVKLLLSLICTLSCPPVKLAGFVLPKQPVISAQKTQSSNLTSPGISTYASSPPSVYTRKARGGSISLPFKLENSGTYESAHSTRSKHPGPRSSQVELASAPPETSTRTRHAEGSVFLCDRPLYLVHIVSILDTGEGLARFCMRKGVCACRLCHPLDPQLSSACDRLDPASLSHTEKGNETNNVACNAAVATASNAVLCGQPPNSCQGAAISTTQIHGSDSNYRSVGSIRSASTSSTDPGSSTSSSTSHNCPTGSASCQQHARENCDLRRSGRDSSEQGIEKENLSLQTADKTGCHSDHWPVLVPFAIQDEYVWVEINRNFSQYSLGFIVAFAGAPSPHRVTARCAYYGRCSGCQYQHMPLWMQHEVKRKHIERLLHQTSHERGHVYVKPLLPRAAPPSCQSPHDTIKSNPEEAAAPCEAIITTTKEPSTPLERAATAIGAEVNQINLNDSNPEKAAVCAAAAAAVTTKERPSFLTESSTIAAARAKVTLATTLGSSPHDTRNTGRSTVERMEKEEERKEEKEKEAGKVAATFDSAVEADTPRVEAEPSGGVTCRVGGEGGGAQEAAAFSSGALEEKPKHTSRVTACTSQTSAVTVATGASRDMREATATFEKTIISEEPATAAATTDIDPLRGKKEKTDNEATKPGIMIEAATPPKTSHEEAAAFAAPPRTNKEDPFVNYEPKGGGGERGGRGGGGEEKDEEAEGYCYRTKLTPHYNYYTAGEIPCIGFNDIRQPSAVVDVQQCCIATHAINQQLQHLRESLTGQFLQKYKKNTTSQKKNKGATLLLRETGHQNGVGTVATHAATLCRGHVFLRGKERNVTLYHRAGDFFQVNKKVLQLLVDYVRRQLSPSLLSTTCSAAPLPPPLLPPPLTPRAGTPSPPPCAAAAAASSSSSSSAKDIISASTFFPLPSSSPFFATSLRAGASLNNNGDTTTTTTPTTTTPPPRPLGGEEVHAQKRQPQHRLLIDAYCGVGLFAITSHDLFNQTFGFDISARSISLATHNAQFNGITNCHFATCDAASFFETFWRRKHSQRRTAETACLYVIVDPPRCGCSSSFLNTLLQSRPTRIVYVSCHPATQARDIKHLLKAKYTITEVQPFDMFPHTRHVECVVTLDDAAAKAAPSSYTLRPQVAERME